MADEKYMEIVTGSTGVAHVTSVDDAVRNTNYGYYNDKVVFNLYQKLRAEKYTENIIHIYSGYGMNQGRFFKIDNNQREAVTIRSGNEGQKREDLIVARYERTDATGIESIRLVVIEGEEGTEYLTPDYETGLINEGDTIDDFPLYSVKINGIRIESIDRLFTLLPDGGRIGQIEVNANLMVQHIANKNNPHEVSGEQLTGVVPISKGGTGASTAAEALVALGVPSDIADAMSKEVYTGSNDAIKVSKGGTGRTSVTSGSVLVGNGTNAMSERTIDSTSGGTADSNSLITSGAVNDGISAEATARTNAINALKQSFTAGCNAIAQKLIAKGVTPTKSGENYTPTDFINAIDTLIASQKRAVAYSISEQSTIISTYTQDNRTYHVSRNVVSVNIGGVLTQHSYDQTWYEGQMGGNEYYFSEKTWTQNV